MNIDYKRAPFWSLIPAGPIRHRTIVRALIAREIFDEMVARFDENQPRDENGRWTDWGTSLIGAQGLKTFPPEYQQRVQDRLDKMGLGKAFTPGGPVDQNLDKLFQAGTADHERWYYEEHDRLAALGQKYGVSTDTAAAVMAATSAQADVKKNEEFTEEILNAYAHPEETITVTREAADLYNAKHGDDPVKVGEYTRGELSPTQVVCLDPTIHCGHTGYAGQVDAMTIVRAPADEQRDYADRLIGGPKQRNFANNLSWPEDPQSTTIDTWMYRAALDDNIKFKPRAGDEPMLRAEFERRSGGKLPKEDPEHIGIQGFNRLFQNTPSAKGIADGVGTYPVFADAVARIAEKYGVSPSEAQARIWWAAGGGQ